MINFICNNCGQTKQLTKVTLEVVDNKVRTREAKCSCGKYMQEASKDFSGFPNIIRTEPTLTKK